ncbi:MAG: dockerin type I domain-containing protein, partial [Planctomycetota bacterium]
TPQIIDGKLVHQLSSAASTLSLSNTTPYRNPFLAVDTDYSGSVSAIDALVTIDALNQGGGQLPPLGEIPSNFFYLDISGDGFLSAIDALLVIDFLNQRQGEGELGVVAVQSGYCELVSEEDSHLQASRQQIISQVFPSNMGVQTQVNAFHYGRQLILIPIPREHADLYGPEMPGLAVDFAIEQLGEESF